jgi:hypothetical protein
MKQAGYGCRPFWMKVESSLEAETCTEFSRERSWQQAAGGVNKAERPGKGAVLDYVVEVVAVIGMVKEVEMPEMRAAASGSRPA